MIECLLPELLLRVVEHGFREWGAGQGDAGDCLRFWRFEVLLVAEEGGDIARLGCPAVGFEGRRGGHDDDDVGTVGSGGERSSWVKG